jgi:YfiH family protein
LKSELLYKHGLINYISGSEYDISYKRKNTDLKNYTDKIFNKLDLKPDTVYYGIQVHADNIEYCDGNNGKDFPCGKFFESCDGLITDKKNIALVIKFADCTPVLLYDPVKKVQASVHSGWRGTVKRISEKAIEKMIDEFSCKRENILAYVGPSIDQNNYEVGQDVYDAFKDFKNRDELFIDYKEKYKLNMVDANLSILLDNGIKRENIEVSTISTYDNLALNSARRQKENHKLNGLISIIK